MKKKTLLLVLFLLTVLLALPTTCNAEEAPTMKWEETEEDLGYFAINTGLYNINNDILAVHNSSTDETFNYKEYYNYVRLYNTSGEKKWEYNQGEVMTPYFLINDEYVGIIDYLWSSDSEKKIRLLNLKDGTVYKKIDISKIVENLEKYTSLLNAYYYNNKIILLFYDRNTTQNYYFYTIDLDGNIKLLKTAPLNTNYYNDEMIAIGNTIYGIDEDNITTFSAETGEITSTIPTNKSIDIARTVKYKDGIMYCGSIDGYMAMEYYDLKTGTTQVKQFEEEGTIYSVSTDNKDNLYIAGKYIDDNTTGKAYFAKYTNDKKVYESFYEKKAYYDEFFYSNMLVLKNNKLVLAGNTYDFGKYIFGINYVTFYDGTKSYKIDKVINGSGNIDIVESIEEDSQVKYKVKPAFGYKLISLKIVTESGKGIEVSDDYTFIMPNENITITAVFEPIISNPVTSNNIIKILLELVISISIVYLITKSIRKKKFNN